MNKILFCKTVFVAACVAGMGLSAFAQVSHGGTPHSFKHNSFDAFAVAALPAMDNQALLQEEAEPESKEDGYQFGKEIAVDYRLDNSGTWEDLPDGGRLWRLGIKSKGAYSINLLFDHFYIPPASHLFIYTADKSFVLGSFTAENNNKWGNFATTLLPGDAIVLEFYEAAQDRNDAVIHLTTVVHGYKDFFFQKTQKGQYGSSGYCNVNVNCGIGNPYQQVKQAVALILNGGSRKCSGTLINNTARDTTPYFLTAYHCVNGLDLSRFMFIFNYETVDCEGNVFAEQYSCNGATKLASGDTSDFALLLLNDRPPFYYAGWSRKDSLYKGVVGIHHPSGDLKKISEDRKTIGSANMQYNTIYPDNTHYVVVWDTGTTEYVSSGSGLFNRESLLLGQLEGGDASCYKLSGEDFYGKIAYSWTNNDNQDSNRLDYWLDPLKLGVETLEGLDAFDTSKLKIIEKQENTVSIYPNPTTGKFSVFSYQLSEMGGAVEIFDMMGRKLLSHSPLTSHSSPLIEIDISHLSAGMYFLKIQTSEGIITKKIIKNQ